MNIYAKLIVCITSGEYIEKVEIEEGLVSILIYFQKQEKD
jgi:hypothetical protein